MRIRRAAYVDKEHPHSARCATALAHSERVKPAYLASQAPSHLCSPEAAVQ